MISIAMTTYNGQPYIRQQVASILGQLTREDELVISDDGSIDGTLEWLQVQAATDQRIKLLAGSHQKGVVANVALALEQCRGELIFLSDQDDVWLPGRIHQMTLPFVENPDLLLVQADAELIDSTGQIISPSFFALRHCGPGIWKNIYKNTWQGCSICIRKKLIPIVLPFPKYIPMHDMWLGIIAELSGQVCFLPIILTQYRRHQNNQSTLHRSAWRRVITWRFQLVQAVLRKSLHRVS